MTVVMDYDDEESATSERRIQDDLEASNRGRRQDSEIHNNNNTDNLHHNTTITITSDDDEEDEDDEHDQHDDDDDDVNWQRLAEDPYAASPGSKYDRYALPVVHDEGDRALRISLCSCQRPHMRGLHCAWISFFMAFMVWFAPAPLLKVIQDDLNLSKQQVWNSSIANDICAIVMRIVIGPVCDGYGARLPMAAVLMVAAIPCSMLGLVNTAAGLSVLRFFVGIAGSSFVMAQFWPSRMFSREIAGTANGIVAGWGNLGGAVTQVFMGSFLFPVFRDSVYDGNAEKAWRTICVIPAAIAFIWGAIVPWISDDAPMGNYSDMRKKGTMDRIFFTTSLRSGAKLNTWILYIQYAASFGVELVMNNASVLYFNSEFGLPTEDGAKLGFIYGSLNIFARGLGGYISDKLNVRYGLRGRLWLIVLLLLCEGAIIIGFSYADTLTAAIATMCAFSVFTQSAEGAIYGVVPYVSKLYTGSVSGLVGAGGNVGSVVFALGFRSLEYRDAFVMMGSIAMASSVLSAWLRIPCHAGLLTGEDNHAVIKARERFQRRLERELMDSSTSRTDPAPRNNSNNNNDDNNTEDDPRQERNSRNSTESNCNNDNGETAAAAADVAGDIELSAIEAAASSGSDATANRVVDADQKLNE